MSKKFSGMYVGAGTSALHLGFGFVPDKVRIQNIDQSQAEELVWTKEMARAATGAEGIIRVGVGDTPSFALLTFGAGVVRYYGQDLIGTASAQYQMLAQDLSTFRGDMRQKGTDGDLNAWVLDTAATPTGHWNAECNTTYVGVGSEIQIDGKTYAVTALTSNGEATDEVTLSEAAPTGDIEAISYLYDFAPATAGLTMPAGIQINDTSYVNVSGQKCLIEAEQLD